MKISIIGTGWVGLVTAAIFADFGNEVVGIDIDQGKIDSLKEGKVPFFETALEELIKRNLKANRLKFTTSYEEEVPESDVIFICVGTPSNSDGEADLSSVFNATKKIAQNLKGYTVVVGKSTIPVGTGEKLIELINQYKDQKATFDWVANPEFLREGTAIEDSLHPDRVIIGSQSQKATEIMLKLHDRIASLAIITDIKSAEMIKYASNALLSTKISFANAIAILCEKLGADAEAVFDGVGADKRLGRSMLYPGVGYGGSCFPKDVLGLIKIAEEAGYNFKLLKAVDEINRDQSKNFIKKINDLLGGEKGKTVAVLGLSFKPNTDDLREAPSLKIIEGLQKLGYKVRAYDPVATAGAGKILKGVIFAKDTYEAADGADCLAIVTEWSEFTELDLGKLKKLLKSPIIIDGRNVLDKDRIKEAGFTYKGVGR